MNNRDRHLFLGLDRPELPDNLQQQVLWRARAALRSPIPRGDLWERIRTNRGWRLAWVVSVTALCAANLTIGGWMTVPPARPFSPAHIAPDPEITAIIDLPRLKLTTIERLGSRGDSQDNRDTEDPS